MGKNTKWIRLASTVFLCFFGGRGVAIEEFLVAVFSCGQGFVSLDILKLKRILQYCNLKLLLFYAVYRMHNVVCNPVI